MNGQRAIYIDDPGKRHCHVSYPAPLRRQTTVNSDHALRLRKFLELRPLRWTRRRIQWSSTPQSSFLQFYRLSHAINSPAVIDSRTAYRISWRSTHRRNKNSLQCNVTPPPSYELKRRLSVRVIAIRFGARLRPRKERLAICRRKHCSSSTRRQHRAPVRRRVDGL